MKRIIFSLVIVLMLVMTALFAACAWRLSPNLPPEVAQPSGWPTTWTGLSTDPDEGSGCNSHRNVVDNNMDGYALYYAADSQYLYLRMETVDPPGWPGTNPQGQGRYKWWFCTAGTAAWVDGTTVKGAEFQLILEDLTDNSNDPDLTKDQLGELTLMDDLNNDGFKSRWDSAHPPNYTINNAQTTPTGNSTWWRRELGSGTAGAGGPQGVMGADIGYRIDNATTGGNFTDMYVSWAALGNPSSLCLIWATDNINVNLDQAPNCDRPVETTCLSVCIPPQAAFDATPTSGCAPLTVNFTDQSTGSPTSWNWTFPGGTPSSHTGQTPLPVTYNSAGSYNVTLTVSNACGSDDETKTNYITVAPLPEADFHASDTNSCVNEEIDFFDDSTGTYDSWYWDFGDGSNSTAENPSHTYASAGTYNVSLTVSNACGSDTETKTNYITVLPLPEADFHASDTSPCVSEAVTFTDDSTGSPTSWSWTFTGGSPSSAIGQGPHTVTYNSPGTYTVSLTVSNACGFDTETKTNYITVAPLPDADFHASNTSPCVNEAVTFTDDSTGSPTSWSWTFTGGSPSSAIGQGPHTVTYNSPGTYTVSLTVSNACGSDTETKTNYITVYAKPTATASSNSPICEGNTIQLTGGPDGMTSYNWTGPNGFSNGSQNPTIPNATTLNAGTYYLRVTDGGCTSDPASTVVVVNESPTADAGADWQIIQGGSVVIGGSPTASGGTPPYTYSWTPTTGLNDPGIANPTASPAVNTTYTVTVIDSMGCTDSDDVTVTLAHGCCICGFVYRAGTMEPLAGWEVILEKKTNPWLEVQRTITDAVGKYCFCGLENGEYRVSEVVQLGWTQVSPMPNQYIVTLPGGASDPDNGPFFNFANTYTFTSNPWPPYTVGWEASPIDKLAVLAPWIALFAVIVAGASLLVLGRRGRGAKYM